MDCNSCEKTTVANTVQVSAAVREAAQRLACMLVDTAELQNFVRSAYRIRQDTMVSSLVNQINEYPGYDASGAGLSSLDDLQSQLEELPAVREYRDAEASAAKLFSTVDAVISSVVGLPFAENAKPAACG